MENELLAQIVSELQKLRSSLEQKPKTANELMTEAEAAEYLRVKPQTLAVWRSQGRPPSYLKAGNSVRYKLSALIDYTKQQTIEC